MNNDLIKHVVLNEEKLIADAYYGNTKALELLESAYDAGYESKYISEDWQKIMPRSNILHPIKGLKNFWDGVVARHHARKIRKLNRKIKKEDDALIQAHKVGADRDTIQNHLDRIKALGDEERQDRLKKYRNRTLNILNRNTGNDAKDEYELEDKNGKKINIYQAINDKTLNPYARKGWNPESYYDDLSKRYRLDRQDEDDNNKGNSEETSGGQSDNQEQQKTDAPKTQQEKDESTSKQKRKKTMSGSISDNSGNDASKQNDSSISQTGSSTDSSNPKSGNHDIQANAESPEPQSTNAVDSQDDDPFNPDNIGKGSANYRTDAKGESIVYGDKNLSKKREEMRESVYQRLSNIKRMLQESKYVK